MKNKYTVIALACYASMSFAAHIGVLKADNKFKCDDQVVIDLDVEDKSNKTRIVSGDGNPPGISLGGHAIFTYCVVDVEEMPKVPFDYAVLRLGRSCPKGGHPIARRHDTEDKNNANHHSGNIWPSNVWENALIEYCIVPADGSSKNKYPLFDKKNGHKYGVFANTSGSNIAHSEIFIDDENDRAPAWTNRGGWLAEGCEFWGATSNGNFWKFCGDYGLGNVMDGDNNTIYHTIRWTGNSTSGMLAKSADIGTIDTPMAEAKPVAASIRGLDRSVISIELKNAGNAKVSVMNINGAVVAKIAEENLQAGIHNLKWNAGVIPNGLYVVTVEHNGMINSKRILLK